MQFVIEPVIDYPDMRVPMEPEMSQKMTECPLIGFTFSAVAILTAVLSASLYWSRSSYVGKCLGRIILGGLLPFGPAGFLSPRRPSGFFSGT